MQNINADHENYHRKNQILEKENRQLKFMLNKMTKILDVDLQQLHSGFGDCLKMMHEARTEVEEDQNV